MAEMLGNRPFPWQERLGSAFMAGEIPVGLDIPTGLGKTKIIAIWLTALASGAAVPRRLIYVVDRRAVVDQATAEAEDTAAIFRNEFGADITISTLRGQHVDSGEWREDPSRPAIVVGTVDMIGSRLLFEGYGISRRMRPLHAGLLGVDSLVVLDEAHLVPPFQALMETISVDPTLAGRQPLPVPRLRLMSLSATQSPGAEATFRIGEDDRRHPEVERRLGAAKLLSVSDVQASKTKGERQELDPAVLAEALAGQATAIADGLDGPARILVYCDGRAVAERVADHLSERQPILFTGARRVHERQRAADELRSAGFMAGAEPPEATRFLIATSAGEVGVDLDADHAIMDLVPWERMVQRLGRVNRRGRGSALVRVVDPGLANSPSGARLDSVRRLLRRLPPTGGAVQAGPGALGELAAREPDLVREATTPEPLRPALSRPLVDAWALTGLPQHTGRPEVDPWLRGWVEVEPQTRIVWREHLPRRAADPAVQVAEVEAFFAHARPHLSEMLETETYRATDWLYARAKAFRGSDTGAEREKRDKQEIVFLLDPDGGLHARLTLGTLALWAGRKIDRQAQRERDAFEHALAGRTLVVDAALGGLDAAGLLKNDQNEAPSVADGAGGWPEVGFTIQQSRPGDQYAGAAYRFVTRFSAEGDPETLLDIFLQRERQDTDIDAPSRAARDVPLAEHASAVEAEVRRIAGRLGLEPRWVELLAAAARLHDHGKAAPVWQEAMNAPRAGRPYAKTRGGGNPTALGRYRHEFGSLFAAQSDPAVQAMNPDDRDLLLHLIAAHHGNARPTIWVENCPEGPPTAMAAAGLEVALRFARLQTRWGPWGLAWWESLLRAADQTVSKEAG
nr:type I-U CRISPR-associated helicase/endonuclease Cas3 [Propylenella binzhouense]